MRFSFLDLLFANLCFASMGFLFFEQIIKKQVFMFHVPTVRWALRVGTGGTVLYFLSYDTLPSSIVGVYPKNTTM